MTLEQIAAAAEQAQREAQALALQELNAKKAAEKAEAIAQFSELLDQHLSPEFRALLPNFRLGTMRAGTASGRAGCAYFDLIDEWGCPWHAQLEPNLGGAGMSLFVPNLENDPKHMAAQRRAGSYRTWKRIEPEHGLTWEQTIALTIKQWGERCKELTLLHLVDDIKNEIQALERRDLDQTRDLKRLSSRVDNTLINLEIEQIEQRAKHQDRQIRDRIASEVRVKSSAMVYKWRWCSGATEDEFEYDVAYSVNGNPDPEGWIDRIGQGRIKLTAAAMPTVEEVVFTLKNAPSQLTEWREVKLLNVAEVFGRDLYVYSEGDSATYRYKVFSHRVDYTHKPDVIEFDLIDWLLPEEIELISEY